MSEFKNLEDIEIKLQQKPSLLTDNFILDGEEFSFEKEEHFEKTFKNKDNSKGIIIGFDCGWVYTHIS